MLDLIPNEEQKNKPDPGYLAFLNKVWFAKSFFWALFTWLCIFSYLFFFIFLGQSLQKQLLWTVVSLPITYFGFIIWYPIVLWYYRKHIQNHWWALGDNSIFVHHGVLTSHLARIPYGRIQNLNTVQSFYEKIGRFYSIHIETAGGTTTPAEGRLHGIRIPEDVVKLISEKISLHKEKPLGDSVSEYSENISSKSVTDSDIKSLLTSINENLKEIKEILKK